MEAFYIWIAVYLVILEYYRQSIRGSKKVLNNIYIIQRNKITFLLDMYNRIKVISTHIQFSAAY